jgi:uncharacterized protein YndB with AHSA1/START domain
MTNPANKIAEDTSAREIVITRLFDAPRDLVFDACSDQKHLERWWGPTGFGNTTVKFDFREGGVWQHIMHGPDGTDYPNYNVFTEIKRPQRFAYRAGKGPDETLFQSTWTFDDKGGKTEVTIRLLFPDAATRNMVVEKFGAIEGGNQTLSRLGYYLTAMHGKPFVISRVIKAPRSLVFDAWTKKEHLEKWFGPKGSEITKATVDFRPGGMFHYGMKHPNGMEMWGKWNILDVVKNTRIVLVSSFSDADGGKTKAPFPGDWPLETLSTSTFADWDGGTLVTINWVPLNATEAERQFFATMHTSMNGGWGGTFDQLQEYLDTAKA